MAIKISVIVPVFNTEKTLKRCVDSILNQTFSDFEIILVDDGSTDGSKKICDDYQKKFDKIKVIHKENEGAGPTRNVGINKSKGEFIYQCDSDDWIEKDTLEKCYNAISNKNADMVIFGYSIYDGSKKSLVHFDNVSLPDQYKFSRLECQNFFIENYFKSFIMLVPWNKLYRKSFIIENNISFKPFRRCQDLIYSLDIFSKVNSVVVLNNRLYNYVIQPGVYKGNNYKETLTTYKSVYDLTKNEVEQWGMLTYDFQTKLENQVCEMIANYTSFCITTIFKNKWRICLNELFSNNEIMEMFENYSSESHSKYMVLFSKLACNRRKILLYILSYILMKKNGIK